MKLLVFDGECTGEQEAFKQFILKLLLIKAFQEYYKVFAVISIDWHKMDSWHLIYYGLNAK